MLNKKLHANNFLLEGPVSDIQSDHVLVKCQDVFVRVEGVQNMDIVIGTQISVNGSYSYENKMPVIKSTSNGYSDLVQPLNGYIEGEVIKVDRMGSAEKPWAKVLLRSTHKNAVNKEEVQSSICLVNLSSGSLATIEYDIGLGDILGVNVNVSNNDVELTLKVCNIKLHYPKPILDLFEKYRQDPLSYRGVE